MEQVYKLGKMKTTSSSGILKNIYHNGSYLLFGKRKLESLKCHMKNSSYIVDRHPYIYECWQKSCNLLEEWVGLPGEWGSRKS